MFHKTRITLFMLILIATIHAQAQDDSNFTFKNGIGVVAPDSSISLHFNINLQNRMDFKTV